MQPTAARLQRTEAHQSGATRRPGLEPAPAPGLRRLSRLSRLSGLVAEQRAGLNRRDRSSSTVARAGIGSRINTGSRNNTSSRITATSRTDAGGHFNAAT